MKKFINHNERYGDIGPFYAENKEQIIQDFRENFELWAREAWDVFCDETDDWKSWNDEQYIHQKVMFLDGKIMRMKMELIEALEEIE